MDETKLEQYPRYQWADLQKKIEAREPFEALSPMSTALLRVTRYEPLMGIAEHAGHRIREEFLSKMEIEEHERQFEEDTGVEEFIADFPVQMIALDSRYEYDINRPRDKAVYLKPFESWGKKVWRMPPTKEELEMSYTKYDEFHELLDYLVEQLVTQFGPVLIIDMHSYNHQRTNLAAKAAQLPFFNVAVSAENRKKHGKLLDSVLTQLRSVEFPGITATAEENVVFEKDGALAMTIEAKHPQSLVLPIEVKKLYLDASTGEPDEAKVALLRKSFATLGPNLLKEYLGSLKK